MSPAFLATSPIKRSVSANVTRLEDERNLRSLQQFQHRRSSKKTQARVSYVQVNILICFFPCCLRNRVQETVHSNRPHNLRPNLTLLLSRKRRCKRNRWELVWTLVRHELPDRTQPSTKSHCTAGGTATRHVKDVQITESEFAVVSRSEAKWMLVLMPDTSSVRPTARVYRQPSAGDNHSMPCPRGAMSYKQCWAAAANGSEFSPHTASVQPPDFTFTAYALLGAETSSIRQSMSHALTGDRGTPTTWSEGNCGRGEDGIDHTA